MDSLHIHPAKTSQVHNYQTIRSLRIVPETDLIAVTSLVPASFHMTFLHPPITFFDQVLNLIIIYFHSE